ncbi:PhzF family phenazine biosynthesis protein [Streptomyces sp. NPDC001422]|uniref:PhzF family phenazine biosynthesis protein n=1 Tax=Streptomyces sp. NPDC001422 TaxID=3364575 RepID=UPI0036C57463
MTNPVRRTPFDRSVHYFHVDVFSGTPFSGNSLAVFPGAAGLSGSQMQRITEEMRHFESIFLQEMNGGGSAWRARVFDLREELDFAGHPVIGAASVLHAVAGGDTTRTWSLELKARTVEVVTERRGRGRYASVLDQGPPQFLGQPVMDDLASWFSLDEEDLHSELRPEIVSTGLDYLIVPVRAGALERARITSDIGQPLARIGAQFAYLLDADTLEGRHWNNDGVVEDVATGSAAGCVAAYLRRHGRLGDDVRQVLRQGRFCGRPSEMTISAHGDPHDITSVRVGGEVAVVAHGRLEGVPQ